MPRTTRVDTDKSLALNEALNHLAAASACLKRAGYAGVTRGGHLDIAFRFIAKARSYAKSGMVMDGYSYGADSKGGN